MTIITCDFCQSKCNPIVVRFRDGEHPHNGSTCYKTVDVCKDCARGIHDLSSSEEFDDMVEKLKNK